MSSVRQPNKPLPLLESIYCEIFYYMERYGQDHHEPVVLLFPLPKSRHTNICINIVAAMLDLHTCTIEGNVLVGTHKNFRHFIHIDLCGGHREQLLKYPWEIRLEACIPKIDYYRIREDQKTFMEHIQVALKHYTLTDDEMPHVQLDVNNIQDVEIRPKNLDIELEGQQVDIYDEITGEKIQTANVSNGGDGTLNLEFPVGDESVDESSDTEDGFIVEYSDGSKHFCVQQTRKLISKSKNAKDMSTQTMVSNIECYVNTSPGTRRIKTNLAELKFVKDVESFVTKFKKYLGPDVKLLLVPARFSDIEKNPIYKLDHVIEAYDVPCNANIEGAFNVRFYTKWCNPTSAVLFTRSAEDVKHIRQNAKNCTVERITDEHNDVLLTTYSILPVPCADYSAPPFVSQS